MANAKAEIQKKATAFAASMNAAVKDKRDKHVAALEKKGDKKADDKVVQIEFDVSKNPVSLDRTPEQQAETVAAGTSWTCASAHMVDMARHVAMYYTLPGKKRQYSVSSKEPFGSGDEFFMSYSDFTKEWGKQLKSHDLRNYTGGQAFAAKDAWHVELPNGKLLHTDPAVTRCLQRYAEITRLEGGKPNKKFESESSWKKDLAPILKAVEAEKEKRDLEELKKLQFSGTSSGVQTLMSNVSKSQTEVGKPFPDIDIVGPWNTGARKEVKVVAGTAAVWDSLARSIFEKLGLEETSGFDVKLSCGVEYQCVTYENLSQSFITGLTPKCVLIYNTPAARWMKMNVKVDCDVKLAKTDKVPAGRVDFTFELVSPVGKDKGSISVTITGGKAKAVSSF